MIRSDGLDTMGFPAAIGAKPANLKIESLQAEKDNNQLAALLSGLFF